MTSAATLDLAPGLENCLFPAVREQSYAVTRIDGEVPPHIRGTYYLNGPARFQVGGLRYRNWLDGDGMVCALHFDDRGVWFTNRFVRGRKYLEESRLGKPVYATVGTRFSGDRMRRGMSTEPPYNVSIHQYGDALLAFGEQSIPLELDPVTLETRGDYDFDRQLNSLSPFSAHPKVDADTGELINFGVSYTGQQAWVNYYRITGDGTLACRRRTPIDYASSIHDFAVSTRHAAFYVSPYVLDASRLVRDGVATVDALDWRPELGGGLLVLSREDGREVARVPLDGRYCLHTVNSFEDNDTLTVDVIELDRPVYDQYQPLPDVFADSPMGRPTRLTVDLGSRRLIDRRELPTCGTPDFPAIDPRRQGRPYDDIWMLAISTAGTAGRKFFDTLVHARWSSHADDRYRSARERYLGGEPVFVPDTQHERAGAVICQEMDAGQSSSDFLIFDAFNIAAGPVARLHLDSPIHFGFHATFVPDPPD